MFLAPAVLLVGCGRQLFYPVPAQRTPSKHSVMVTLDASPGRPPETWGAIVSGLRVDFAPGANWRWAGKQAEFTFSPPDFDDWSLAVRLTAAEAVLDKAGPQTIVFSVNGRPVGAATLTESRTYELKFALGAELLKAANPVTVQMAVSPCIPAGAGPAYCVLLHTVGLVQGPQ